MLECAIALAVLSVIATSVATSSNADLRYFARSHEETVAGRAAAARIERLSAAKSAPGLGATTFALDADAAKQLRDAAATQTVSLVEPGLYRVETEVTWRAADGGTARAKVATLLAREASK
jgi:type II secretory pathway pseudopilin PulG